MRKALSVIGDIVIAMIVIFSALITTMVIISTRNEDGVPAVMGYAIMNVETDSMVGPDGFDPGTLIVVKKLTEDEIENDLRPGDVITFRRFFQDEAYLETHRIVEITEKMVEGNPACSINMSEVVNGAWRRGDVTNYVTRGDNTPGEDLNASGNFDFANKFNVIGIYTGKSVPKLGSVMKFLRSPSGFMICIVIPVLLFFIYQLYIFIMTITRKQKEKALEEVSSKEEELKQKAIAEFLAQQQAAGNIPAPPADSSAAPPSEPQTADPEAEPVPAETTDAEPAQDEPASAATTEEEPKSGKKSKKKNKKKNAEEPKTEETPAEESAEETAEESEEKPEEEPAEAPAADSGDEPKEEAAEETEEKSEDEPAEAPAAESGDEPKEEAAEETEEKPEEEPAEAPAGESGDEPKEEVAEEAKPADAAPEISEEEKNRIIQEYLAKQAQEQKSEE